MQTKEQITAELNKIFHPAINLPLMELGILQDVDLWYDTVIVTFVFPFPNIPIADKLIESVKNVVEKMGLQMQYIVRVMKSEEKEAFLKMEKEAWKGL
ncbi:MAG: iron-sulfur cluster assembly protein [Draconibacterium sp.]